MSSLEKSIKENIKIKKLLLKKKKIIYKIINQIYLTLNNKGKILTCGNGGSAADAQHLAAEFMVRLRPNINRAPLPVISLALDSSTITACANDIGFEKIFSRNLQAIGSYGDLLLCISTSGNSKNIIEVLKMSKKMKIPSICFLGNNGGLAKNLSNVSLIVPSKNVARIQEAHIFLGHYIFEQVENKIINKNYIFK
jgi:D-sedoheptulose 7-phosphate isomerase